MRLAIKLAAPWAEVSPCDTEEVAFTRADLGVRLAVSKAGDRFAPAARDGRALATTDLASADGWPVRAIERVTSPGAAELELQFQLFELGASVIISGGEAAIREHRDALLSAALAARPDWSGPPRCVSELFAT